MAKRSSWNVHFSRVQPFSRSTLGVPVGWHPSAAATSCADLKPDPLWPQPDIKRVRHSAPPRTRTFTSAVLPEDRSSVRTEGPSRSHSHAGVRVPGHRHVRPTISSLILRYLPPDAGRIVTDDVETTDGDQRHRVPRLAAVERGTISGMSVACSCAQCRHKPSRRAFLCSTGPSGPVLVSLGRYRGEPSWDACDPAAALETAAGSLWPGVNCCPMPCDPRPGASGRLRIGLPREPAQQLPMHACPAQDPIDLTRPVVPPRLALEGVPLPLGVFPVAPVRFPGRPSLDDRWRRCPRTRQRQSRERRQPRIGGRRGRT